MKRLLMLILCLCAAFAACVDNGICSPEETTLGCADCSFGNVCVDDGMCTNVELQEGCADCSSAPKARCVNDGACTASEQKLGDCNDCQQASPITGLLVFAVGGLGLVLVLVVAAVVVAMFAYNKHQNRRIRL